MFRTCSFFFPYGRKKVGPKQKNHTKGVEIGFPAKGLVIAFGLWIGELYREKGHLSMANYQITILNHRYGRVSGVEIEGI